MANPYYTPTGNPATQTRGTSANMRNEFDAVAGGFDDVYAEILALAAAIGVAVTVSEVPLASASTTDIGNGYGPVLLITGSTPINSFGANYKGAIFLRFQGSLQINHSSTLQCPGGINITTQADDACIAVPIGDPANGWRIMAYCRVSQGIIDDIAVKTSSNYADPAWLTSLAWAKITGKPTTLAGYGITDAPQKDGTGATGSWPISITGSAASSTSASTATTVTGTVASGAEGTTQDQNDNSLKIATTEYADAVYASMRQTIVSGPVDSNGFPSFGGSVGSATFTMAGTLIAVAANAAINRKGSITNAAWTSPAGSGTGYLNLTINADGTCTPVVRALPWICQEGGSYSTTNGQLTFNIQEMTMKLGNGSAANQVYEVCVGECPHTAGVWSGSPIWYQLNGRYVSAFTSTLPSASSVLNFNHNLGVKPRFEGVFEIENTTTDAGYSVGDPIFDPMINTASGYLKICKSVARNTATLIVYTALNNWFAPNKSTGASTNLTNASWKYRYKVDRGWGGS
jgi:hypothetical protein